MVTTAAPGSESLYADFVTAMMAFFLLDVADQHHQPRAEARHRRLFRAGQRVRDDLGRRRHPVRHRSGQRGGQAERLPVDRPGRQPLRSVIPTTAKPKDRAKSSGQRPRSPWSRRKRTTQPSARPRPSPRRPSRCAKRCRTCRCSPSSPRTSSSTRRPKACASSSWTRRAARCSTPAPPRPNGRAKILLRGHRQDHQPATQPDLASTATPAPAPAREPPRAKGDAGRCRPARADASRNILEGAGVDSDRVYQTSGKATSEPLYPDDPTLPRQPADHYRPLLREEAPPSARRTAALSPVPRDSPCAGARHDALIDPLTRPSRRPTATP